MTCLDIKFSAILLLFVIVTQFTVSSVHWVPIVERNNRNSDDASVDPISAAFQQTNQIDQIHKEKFVRIAKMLNNSLETQESELKEGNKKLEDLRHGHTSHSYKMETHLIIIAAVYKLLRLF